MKNVFLISVLVAFTSIVFAQTQAGSEMNATDVQADCGCCGGCPHPAAVLQQGLYRVSNPSNYFEQYVEPKFNCGGAMVGLSVWYKDTSSTADSYTCNGGVCRSSNGRTISIQTETSYIFQDGTRPPGTFVRM